MKNSSADLEKRTILLLHGALGSSDSFLPFKQHLQGDFDLLIPDFEGHGRTSLNKDGPFRMEHFAEKILSFLREAGPAGRRVHLFGYSMGGYVALLLARNHPELFHNVFTWGTRFFWTEESGKREASFLDPEKMERKVPKFAQRLQDLHGADKWKLVVEKTAAMLMQLGGRDLLGEGVLKEIAVPVRVGLGDRDQMAGLENSLLAYRSLSRGELVVLPGTDHPLETADVEQLTGQIRQFALGCGQ